MKFISKFSNYRVVLRPGTPGNRATGLQPVPGLYVKFEGGIAEVENEEHIEMLMKHPAFGKDRDFISAPEDGNDPFSDDRKGIEPAHNITEIKYGQAGKSVGDKPKAKLSDMQRKAVKEMAADIVAELLPKAVEAEIARRNADKADDNVASMTHSDTTAPLASGDVNTTSNIVDEKITAPDPIEDNSEPKEDKKKEEKIVKEEAKVGGVENADVNKDSKKTKSSSKSKTGKKTTAK